MRCFSPHVESAQFVLLFVLACCSAAAQSSSELASPHITSVAKIVPSRQVDEATYQSLLNDPKPQQPSELSKIRSVEFDRPTGAGFGMRLPASVANEMQPPIYPAWYFYMALGLLLIGIPVHRYRRRVQVMQGHIGVLLEERNRIARECHDTLMAGFTAIHYQLEATAKLFRDGDLDSTPAARSCELARTMVSRSQAEARRIIWDLRDTRTVTQNLSEALSRTLEAEHLSPSIATALSIEGNEHSLSPGCVHHLACIGQEAITNAVRHAQPTRINVLLKYEGDALSLSIHDNGRGFHASGGAASLQGHFGIQVMEERTRKLGGTFCVQTSIGSGTEVIVRVPLNAMQQPRITSHIMRRMSV